MADTPEPVPPVEPAKRKINPLWIKYGVGLAVTIVAGIFGINIGINPNVPDVPIFEGSFGWKPDSEQTEKVRSSLPVQWFGETPAGKVLLADVDEDVFQWNAAKTVLGEYLEARNQLQVGSCTGFGTINAIEHLILLQIARAMKLNLPPPGEFKELSQEAVYALSRVEIGKGIFRGGDGSLTSYTAQAVQRFGVLPRGTYGNVDLSEYSETRCRQWGETGLPDDLEEIAKQSPVKQFTYCRSTDEVIKALRQDYPISIGSMIGVSATRDRNGLAKWDRSWSHCMCINGYTPKNGGMFHFVNSWGETYHRGPAGPGDPPEGGFWLSKTDLARALKDRNTECIAFSDAVGFPNRKIDWTVKSSGKLIKPTLLSLQSFWSWKR